MLKQQIIAYAVNAVTLLAVSTASVVAVKKRGTASNSHSEVTSVDKNSEKLVLVLEIFGVFIALSLGLLLISYLQRW
jgi:hypothetical protein